MTYVKEHIYNIKGQNFILEHNYTSRMNYRRLIDIETGEKYIHGWSNRPWEYYTDQTILLEMARKKGWTDKEKEIVNKADSLSDAIKKINELNS